MKELDDYQAAVLRTEGPPSDAMARLYTETDQRRLLAMMKMLFPILKEVDQFKKSIFYGKEAVYVLLDSPQVLVEEFTCGVAMVRRMHAVIGMLTECGELMELLQRSIFHGEVIDEETWLKEFGDIGWYQALGVATVNKKLSECAQLNIDKLKRRYPVKFTETLAQGHDSH